MKKVTLAVLAACSAFTFASEAEAARIYSYVTDQPSYTTEPGKAVAVKFYLREQLTAGETSLINGDNGLGGAGLRVIRSGTGANLSILGTLTRNTVEFTGPGFESVAPGLVSFSVAAPLSPPNGIRTGNTAGNTVTTPPDSVFLGTIQVTGGSGPGVTTFDLRPITGGGNTLTNNTGYDLDFNSTNPAYTGASSVPTSFSMNVTEVPEPAGLGVIAALGTAGLLRRRRRAVVA